MVNLSSRRALIGLLIISLSFFFFQTDRISLVLDDKSQHEEIQELEYIPNRDISNNGFLGEDMFHVVLDGRKIEGVFATKLSTFSFSNKRRSSNEFEGKGRKFLGGNCLWCPFEYRDDTDCIEGSFYVSWYKDNYSPSSLIIRNRSFLFKMRAMSLNNNGKGQKSPEYSSVLGHCFLKDKIPERKKGLLKLQGMNNRNISEVVIFNVNPYIPISTRTRSSFLCLKGAWGNEVSLQALELFAHLYLNIWKVDVLVVYEVGLVFGELMIEKILASKKLAALYFQKRIVVVDLRNAMQRLYGGLSQDVSLFTTVSSQLITISDCLIRGKVEGLQWGIVIDMDELLLSANPDRQEIWSDFVARQERNHANLSEPLNVINFKGCTGSEEICKKNNCKEDWNYYEAGPCTAGDGAFKYAVRLNFSNQYPLISNCGIHHVANSGSFQKQVGVYSTAVPINDMYILHLRCFNKLGNCDQSKEIISSNEIWPVFFGSEDF